MALTLSSMETNTSVSSKTKGTYTFASGKKETGYYMDDKFLPEICEGMGLSKGTSEFGQCVLKLIDKL